MYFTMYCNPLGTGLSVTGVVDNDDRTNRSL